jgi:hypothetical protein
VSGISAQRTSEVEIASTIARYFEKIGVVHDGNNEATYLL